VLQVLGAVGTGIGVLGFVAAVGGMIVYTRADAAGLPADHALGVVPRASLVATGAVTLVPAVALAFLFVLLLFCVNAGLDQIEKRKLAGHIPAAEHVEEKAAYALEEARACRDEARQAQQRADSTQKELEAMHRTAVPSRDRVDQLTHAHTAAVKEVAAAEHEAADCERRAELLVTSGKKLRAEYAEASTKVQWGVRVVVGTSLFGLQLLALAVLGPGARGFGQWFTLLALSAATALVSITIYSKRSRLFMFIVSAFVALGLFIGFASYYRTKNTPKVAPAAALRSDGTIVFGYFVAETDKDVYIARPSVNGVEARIVQLPRSEVTDVSVGQLIGMDNPLLYARGIARQLCSEGARGASAVGASSKKPTAAPDPAPAPVLDPAELRCANSAEAARQALQSRHP
jgi:outer membrane murein-binding lipoprotein Lpp